MRNEMVIEKAAKGLERAFAELLNQPRPGQGGEMVACCGQAFFDFLSSRYLFIAAAAILPWPIASITVAAPRTISPPAQTPSIEVLQSLSMTMFLSLLNLMPGSLFLHHRSYEYYQKEKEYQDGYYGRYPYNLVEERHSRLVLFVRVYLPPTDACPDTLVEIVHNHPGGVVIYDDECCKEPGRSIFGGGK